MCAGVANTCVAEAASDVQMYYLIHLRLGDQQDRPVNVFENKVLRELRYAHEVGWVQLVFVQGVVIERLKHVDQ